MSHYVTLHSNPIVKAGNDIKQIREDIETFKYWINPLNWFIEIHQKLHWLINHPETGYYMIAATIIGAWFIMLGANFPKKWLFWGWIVYWVLKGFIYNF